MIKLLCVGLLKEKYIKEAVDDYVKRISKYHKLEMIELKDSNEFKEEIEILTHLKGNEYVILLDLEGKEYNSLELSNKIHNLFLSGKSNITFIIGGSNGVTKKIKDISKEKISFSKLTFPHGLFRVIFLEQLYRSFKILNNETYHK